MAIQELLQTTNKELFTRYWEKYLLFSKASVNISLANQRLDEWPKELLDIVIKNTSVIATKNSLHVDSNFLLHEEVGGLTPTEKLLMMHEEGYTVYIQSIEKYFEELKDLKLKLEKQIYPLTSHFNIFLSPGGSIGLKPHFDSHDSIIWQLKGNKHWSFWKAHSQSMTDHVPDDKEIEKNKFFIENERPLYEHTLEANETFFMPRGVIHGPRALDYSIHLAIWLQAPLIESIKKVDENFAENNNSYNFF